MHLQNLTTIVATAAAAYALSHWHSLRRLANWLHNPAVISLAEKAAKAASLWTAMTPDQRQQAAASELSRQAQHRLGIKLPAATAQTLIGFVWQILHLDHSPEPAHQEEKAHGQTQQ